MRVVTQAGTNPNSHPLDPDHARVLRAIARHRSAKAAGDEHAAQVALQQAQQALEAHLAAMRQASR